MFTIRDAKNLAKMIGLSLIADACGSGPTQELQGDSTAAGAEGTQAEHWRGIQSCKGYVGDNAITTTSDEAAIDNYTETTTRVHITGVRVGPSPDYSCGPLDFDGVVTDNGGATRFENNMNRSCTSASGAALLVGDLDGYDLDTRTHYGVPLGDWTVKFDLKIADLGDAGTSDRTGITCSFELTLM